MPGAHSVQGMSSSNLNVQEDPQAQVNHPFGTSITTSNTANAVPDQMHLVEAQLVPDAEEDKDQQDPGNVLQAKPVKTLTCCGKLIQANLILLAVILLLCIALVVALSVALSAHKKAPASTPLTTPVTTNTTAGPMEDHELSRFELFRSVLSPLVTANGDLFESPETPQYKALHWLANEDAANLSIVEHGNRRITQRYVLAVLYFSTNGPHWEHSYNFLSPDHECDWKAKDYKENDRGVVECNVLWGTVVTNIQLYWNNLTGTIPDEIGALSSLQYLGLNINNLHGEIPKTLPVSLNQLFINDNNFTGTMPVEVASLKNLDALSIYNNPGLTGSLDFLCQERTIRWFPADCGGSSPAVDCPCCSNCCDAEASLCCDVGSNSTDSCWDPTPVKDTSDVFDDDVF